MQTIKRNFKRCKRRYRMLKNIINKTFYKEHFLNFIKKETSYNITFKFWQLGHFTYFLKWMRTKLRFWTSAIKLWKLHIFCVHSVWKAFWNSITGDLDGQAIEPPSPIHHPGNVACKLFHTSKLKCGYPPFHGWFIRLFFL